MLKLLLTLFLVIVITFTSACPQNKKKKAAEASFQFSGLVLDLVRATDRAFTEGLIDVSQKDLAVVSLRKLNAGAKTLNSLVEELTKENEASQLVLIQRVLSEEIIDPVLSFLSTLGARYSQIEYLRTLISSIRISILTLSNLLSDAGHPIDTRRLELEYV